MGVKPNVEKFKQDLIDAYGYLPFDFLSEYKGTMKPLKYRCKNCGHEDEIKNARGLIYSKGTRKHLTPPCKKCSETYNSQLVRGDFENKFLKRIKKLVETSDVIDLSNDITDLYQIIEYNGNKKDSTFICNVCKQEFIATPTNIIQSFKINKSIGYYCPNCNNMKRLNKELTPYERFNELWKDKIEILTPIEDIKTTYALCEYRCKICDHKWSAYLYNKVKNIDPTGCPNCSATISQSRHELELTEYIKSFYDGVVEEKNRSIIKGNTGHYQEIDIYLPEKKIGFEIDGLYYHSIEKKDKNYHLEKTEKAKKAGIKLYHIFYSELESKQELVYKKVKHILNCSNNLPKIRASDCKIIELTPKEKNDFLNKYHIQGEDRSSVKLGLVTKETHKIFQNRLVAVMTFKVNQYLKPKNNLNIELSRFATDTDLQIYGAFEKLLKYFMDTYEWQSIRTYADKRWSQPNNIYESTNLFKKLPDSKPDYWYFKRNNEKILYHRSNFQIHKLKEKYPDICEDVKKEFGKITEFEVMEKLNYRRIYDCGCFVYEILNEEY